MYATLPRYDYRKATIKFSGTLVLRDSIFSVSGYDNGYRRCHELTKSRTEKRPHPRGSTDHRRSPGACRRQKIESVGHDISGRQIFSMGDLSCTRYTVLLNGPRFIAFEFSDGDVRVLDFKRI